MRILQNSSGIAHLRLDSEGSDYFPQKLGDSSCAAVLSQELVLNVYSVIQSFYQSLLVSSHGLYPTISSLCGNHQIVMKT